MIHESNIMSHKYRHMLLTIFLYNCHSYCEEQPPIVDMMKLLESCVARCTCNKPTHNTNFKFIDWSATLQNGRIINISIKAYQI